MRFFLTIAVLLAGTLYAQSQENQIVQDPAAGAVLERVANRFKNIETLQSDYELLVEDRKDHSQNASSGNLLLKNKMYRLVNGETTIFFDGTTMWTYDAGKNEVTITTPEVQPGDFMSNPSGFFDSYQRDFKYRYIRQTSKNGVPCHELDLFPKNLNQPYSRIKVFVNTQTNLPVRVSSIGKDGVDFTVTLSNVTLGKEVPDATFVFDPVKYKKVEIVDMRGL